MTAREHPEPRSPNEPLAEAMAAALRPWLGITDPAQLRQAVGRILDALSTTETLEEWARLGIGPYAALAVTRPEPDLDVERLAVAAAARLEGEVSRLRTQLAACTEAAGVLDVERLAEAFTVVQPNLYGQDWPRDDPDDFQFVNPREHARAIAAAYRATLRSTRPG